MAVLRPPQGYISESDPRVAQIGHPAPPWLVNYADLMTELVCFFIILYALSAALNKNVQQASQEVKKMMKEGAMHGQVKIDKDGMKISIDEEGQAAFFKSGSAEPTSTIEGILAKLAPVLKKLAADHDIIVEGYTDNQPISNQYFDSNWELSTARATSVARLLIEKFGLLPYRMGAMGYGQYRPVESNATPEGRAKNRRVVILVKNTATPRPAAGQGPPQPGATAAALAQPSGGRG